jgi:hypothetical protein
MLESFCPQPRAPEFRELLCFSFSGEPTPWLLCVMVNHLHVSKFMQEGVVQ